MFTNITSNKAFIAVYEEIIKDINVKWRDYDGRTIRADAIAKGSTATPPSDPIREGYDFMGWDVGPYYRITFKDYNGTILQDEYIKGGTNATPPTSPTREEYTFTGWDKSYNSVQSDLIITAVYKDNLLPFTVRWLSWDSTVLKTETVRQGKSATPPTPPVRTGYDFVAWNSEYSNIQNDLDITATYEEKGYTVTFLDTDGSTFGTLKVKADSYLYDSSIKFPMPTKQGQVFCGWLPTINNVPITKNMTVTAQYTPFTKDMFALNVQFGYVRKYNSSMNPYQVDILASDKVIDYIRFVKIDGCEIDYSNSEEVYVENRLHKRVTPSLNAWDKIGRPTYLSMMDDLEDQSVSTFKFKNGGVSILTTLEKPPSTSWEWQQILIEPISSGTDTLVWWHKLYGTIELVYELRTDQEVSTYLTSQSSEYDYLVAPLESLSTDDVNDALKVREGRSMYYSFAVLEKTGKADGSKVIITGNSFLLTSHKDSLKAGIKYFVDGQPVENFPKTGTNRVYGEKYMVYSTNRYSSTSDTYSGHVLFPINTPTTKKITTHMTINGVATTPITQVFNDGSLVITPDGSYIPTTSGGSSTIPVTVKFNGTTITPNDKAISLVCAYPDTNDALISSGKSLKASYSGLSSLNDNQYYAFLNKLDGYGDPYYLLCQSVFSGQDAFGTFSIRHRN